MSTSRGEFVMSGYLTKSPPESKIKVAQWHRRWFLLMDSRLVYPLADRYVRLEYYQSEVEAKRLADPKGTQLRLLFVQLRNPAQDRSSSVYLLPAGCVLLMKREAT